MRDRVCGAGVGVCWRGGDGWEREGVGNGSRVGSGGIVFYSVFGGLFVYVRSEALLFCTDGWVEVGDR